MLPHTSSDVAVADRFTQRVKALSQQIRVAKMQIASID